MAGISRGGLTVRKTDWRLNAALIAVAASLSACSSGGSGAAPAPLPEPAPLPTPTPTPAPTPTPTPTPAPGPSPVDADTAEFQRNPTYNQVNLLPALNAGLAGAGALIAFIDTGIDTDNAEFAGRIDPRSADLVVSGIVSGPEARPTPTLQDMDGHGNSVAAIAAGGRNGVGAHGVAPEATILMFRGDDDGPEELLILGEAIAEGVNRTIDADADVLSLSLGSTDPIAEPAFASLFGLTASADIVSVIAAGNGDMDDPEASALSATSVEADGTVIIAGAVNAANQLSDFSNAAGSAAAFFLVAPGEFIQVPQINDDPMILPFDPDDTINFSGTSASVPIIAGAAALIRAQWPQLTAQEVVDILFTSATDLGAPGVDAIYGQGLLNVGAAVQPLLSATTASATGQSIDFGASGAALSPAFGAGFSAGEVVFVDGFGRDFRGRANGLASPNALAAVGAENVIQPTRRLATRAARLGAGSVQFRLDSVSLETSDPAALLRAPATAAFTDEFLGDRADAALDFLATQRAGPAIFSVARGFSPRQADASRPHGLAPVTLLTRNGVGDPFLAEGQDGVASIADLKAFRGARLSLLTARATRDPRIFDAARLDPARERDAIVNARVGLSIAPGEDYFAVETGVRLEEGAAFGAGFGGAIGAVDRSSTIYQSVVGEFGLVAGWRAQARAAVGVTNVDFVGGAGLDPSASDLVSTHFAGALYRRGALAPNDEIAFAVSQPLRVAAGGVDVTLASGFDRTTEAFEFSRQRLAFGDAGREIDFEARYRLSGRGGAFVEAAGLYQMFAGGAAGANESALAGVVRGGFRF
ncbi:MAG: S8 family serine peptidase [Parvularculaceae bacterium]